MNIHPHINRPVAPHRTRLEGEIGLHVRLSFRGYLGSGRDTSHGSAVTPRSSNGYRNVEALSPLSLRNCHLLDRAQPDTEGLLVHTCIPFSLSLAIVVMWLFTVGLCLRHSGTRQRRASGCTNLRLQLRSSS
ncbi:unnamed protein product [Vitrella brassicaformis CCMP3155]|uniref:Uncharacterized protein n=1 Tax=Vitrella brassicaformis (strain CCMP3155) TaxID=1169540 RepID=A0A0G4GEI6_VITBC|nr:unnamed protein product [Vitrella brassicaformis CCMP3155]|eukprot:CEM27778.1 unnamed protein product [Vitrella brassicaformis CCMP3155]